jgi:hypothetical protein
MRRIDSTPKKNLRQPKNTPLMYRRSVRANRHRGDGLAGGQPFRPSHHTGELTLEQVRAQDPGFARLSEEANRTQEAYRQARASGNPQLIQQRDAEASQAYQRLMEYERANRYAGADGLARYPRTSQDQRLAQLSEEAEQAWQNYQEALATGPQELLRQRNAESTAAYRRLVDYKQANGYFADGLSRYPRPSHHTGQLTLEQVRAQDPGFAQLSEESNRAYQNYLQARASGNLQLIQQRDAEATQAYQNLLDYERANGYLADGRVGYDGLRPSHHTGHLTLEQVRAQDPGFAHLSEESNRTQDAYRQALASGNPQLIQQRDAEASQAYQNLLDYERANGYLADGLGVSSPRRSRNSRNRSASRYR